MYVLQSFIKHAKLQLKIPGKSKVTDCIFNIEFYYFPSCFFTDILQRIFWLPCYKNEMFDLAFRK